LGLTLNPPIGIPSSQQKSVYFSEYSGWQTTDIFGVYSQEKSVTFDSTDAVGTWSALVSWIGDTNNNIDYTDITSSHISALGFDPYIEVINPISIDLTPPEFRGIEFSVNDVDVTNGAQSITVKVYVYDAESKPSELGLTLNPPIGIPSSQQKSVYFSEYSGWQTTDIFGVYSQEKSVSYDSTDAVGTWSALVSWIGDTNNNIDYTDITSSHISALGFDPYIEVIRGDVALMDLSLTVASAVAINIDEIKSRFDLTATDFTERPTEFEFDFNYSDDLRYESISVQGASALSSSCSIYFGSGSCSISVSDDWTTLAFIVEFTSAVTGEHEVNAEVSYRGYEADTSNNQAQHKFVTRIIRKPKNDADGDGKADILWRNGLTGQNWLWTMNGRSIIKSAGINNISDLSWQIVGRGDFDGDGKSDIVWRNSTTGRNYVWLMNGFAIKQQGELNYVYDSNWRIKEVADLDGDGKDDIVWHHATRGDTWIYLMDGIKFKTSQASLKVADLDWEIVASGDVNGDGKGDIIWRHKTRGDNYIWLMNGATISSLYVLNNINTNWIIAGAGDINGDGTDDIIWRNKYDGRNWAFLMNNGQIQSSQLINTVANNDWEIADISDLNGDGMADIFWRQAQTGQSYIFLMDGLTISSQGYSNSVSNNWQVIH
jgi:hypothetical protein